MVQDCVMSAVDTPAVGALLEAYESPSGVHDEMVAAAGGVRSPYLEVATAISKLATADLADRSDRLARAFRDQGVTFDLDGEERPFPLDVLPRVIDADEWSTIETGVGQRVRALEAFLADVYGEGRIFAAGVIPRGLVVSSPGFTRPAHGFDPPNGVRIHVAGIDIVRDEAGRMCVLEDNLRCPSGVSYVLANRRALARILPELFTGRPIRPVAEYPARLVEALRAAAPRGVREPTVVMLTPGVFNSAFYEHALLARLMGIELAEGRDLVCRGGDLFVRTTDGEVRVHVVYRRIDDDFLDPLQFRPDSMLGCPGILNAARAGRVAIANAVGNGIADDKLIYCYVPDMIRFYLNEDPVLDNIETYRVVDDDHRTEALKRIDELVWKRVDGSGGKDLVIGPLAGVDELAALRAEVEARPRSFIAQRLVRFSTAPTWVEHGIAPRHVDLRPFAVNDGERVWVLPGGLTRVALRAGGLVVNSSQGGGSKDTWVVGTAATEGSETDPGDGTAVGGRTASTPATEGAAAAAPASGTADASLSGATHGDRGRSGPTLIDQWQGHTPAPPMDRGPLSGGAHQ
jgi:uncharacterized circularly permuted ATP-grasp superfamily protein